MATEIPTNGVAKLDAVETAFKGAAVFKLSGKFAMQALPGSTGLAKQLANGSFDGTYEVDELPAATGTVVNLKSWNLNLRDCFGNILTTFNANLPNHLGGVLGELNGNPGVVLFFAHERFGMGLNLPPGFTGTGTVLPEVFDANGNPHASRFGQITPPGIILIESGQSEPLPQPLKIGNTVIVDAMHWQLKRKHKASQES